MMGVTNNEKIKGNWSFRALIVLPLATVVFGVLMEEAGFIPAMIVLIPLLGRRGQGIQVASKSSLLTIGLTVSCDGRVHLGTGPAVSADQGPVGLLTWNSSTISSSASASR